MKIFRCMVILTLAMSSCCCMSSGRNTGFDIDSLLGATVKERGYNFVNTTADTLILNGQNMPFFRLNQVERQVDDDSAPQLFSIVHYGDSHLYAGYIGEVLRSGLQSRFGNAGLGLVTPYRLGGGYQSGDCVVTSSSVWKSSNVVKGDFDAGITGFTVKPAVKNSKQQTFKIQTSQPYNWGRNNGILLSNEFSSIRVFHDSLAGMIVAPSINLLHDVGAAVSPEDPIYQYVTPIYLKKEVESVELFTYCKGDYGVDGGFSGFSLENGKSGVLYHGIGISSAGYFHWGRSAEAIRRGAALDADMVMVSLGTNDAVGYNFNESAFENNLDMMVSQIREANPAASILLITPTQVFRSSRGEPNDNYEALSKVILEYGVKHGISVLDLYAATSGGDGARNWRKHNLMRSDGIHFNVQGYQLQGMLILRALMNEYNKTL